MARDKKVGNLSKKKDDDSLHFFSFLKIFGIDILPHLTSTTIDVIWCPSARGWIKCNIDEVAVGSPALVACGGIFRDDQTHHLLSLVLFLMQAPQLW